ncbi:MAG: ABC-2 family transporter protein [Bacteriovorax sp.]|nr:ABC-2 family transporter protein [Bacteriovorax sp.]
MISLFFKAMKHNWSAQASNPVNLWAGLTTMIVNNILFLYGMWLMMFAGKPQNQVIFPYYLTLTVLAYIGWGTLNFFLGGLKELGEIIDDGKLEPMLGTPRHPLFLAAISRSSVTALGDLLQGLFTLGFLFWYTGFEWALRAAFASVIVTIAFTAIFIAAGTLAFFMTRGASVGIFIVESTLSFTMYPVTKILEGNSRLILYLIPAALTATLPMEWIENANWADFFIMISITAICCVLSVCFFNFGVKNYRASNYISAK